MKRQRTRIIRSLYLENGETYVWRGAINGKPTELRLGKITEEEARGLTITYSTMARGGIDPRPTHMQMKYGEMAEVMTMPAGHGPKMQVCVNEAFEIKMLAAKDRGRNLAKEKAFLERNASKLMKRPVKAITSDEIAEVLKPVWTRNSGKKMRSHLRNAMAYAIGKGYRETNPAGEAIDALLPRTGIKRTNRKAVHHNEMSEILKAIREADANPIHKAAFEFMTLTATRAGETLGATWEEIDQEAMTWTISANRMKTGREHVVPLSKEAMESLQHGKKTDQGRIFPINIISLDRLREKVGIKGRLDNHGIRAVFKSWAQEGEWKPDVVEACLAHAVGSMVERAYSRAQLIEQRREIMEAYSKFLTKSAGNGFPARTPPNAL